MRLKPFVQNDRETSNQFPAQVEFDELGLPVTGNEKGRKPSLRYKAFWESFPVTSTSTSVYLQTQTLEEDDSQTSSSRTLKRKEPEPSTQHTKAEEKPDLKKTKITSTRTTRSTKK